MQVKTRHRSSEEIRRLIGHPIIDADGHVLEYLPTLWDYMADEGGAALVETMQRGATARWYTLTPDERQARREVRPGFWNWPTESVLDHATASFPALLEERRGELGIDFSLLYPSEGLNLPHLGREDVRRPACRAINRYMAELFAPYPKTMCAVGVVPMHTPGEAIEELEFGVSLGLRAFMFPGNVRREFAAESGTRPLGSFWIDTYGLDSEFDYDPVWKRCVELGVVPAFHSGSTAWTSRRSISNYVSNHVGHFAAANEAVARSLFMGGVTNRFPTLRFAFLEGGVGWACALLGSIIEHWEKRNGDSVWQYDPERFDLAAFTELFEKYASEKMQSTRGRIETSYERLQPGLIGADIVDDFALTGLREKSDFIDRFVIPFSFGCEADDSINPWAFQDRFSPVGVPLNAIFSSDIGHWDVPDVTEVVKEAFEMVDDDLLNEAQFRQFTFENAVDLYTAVNPRFFAGTVIAQDAENAMKERRAARAGWSHHTEQLS